MYFKCHTTGSNSTGKITIYIKRHYPHGEEVVMVTDGRVSLTCGEHVLMLEPGDSCHYDGRVPHALENAGDVTAKVLIAMTPAAFEPMFRVNGTHLHTIDSAIALDSVS